MKKVAAILLCAPLFPLHLFAVWYAKSDNGVKTNFRKESVEYWRSVVEVIRQNGGEVNERS